MHGRHYVLLAILFVVVITSADDSKDKKTGDTPPNKNKGGAPKNKDEANDAGNDYGYTSYMPYGPSQYGSPFQPYEIYRERSGVSNPESMAVCNTLIDPEYPIFSDICGAVPQARYALPNTYGHTSRWQLSYILRNIIGSTTDPSCIRSLRHLLCPMLFQSCFDRYEPPLVLPCQYSCRAIKTRCNIPALDVIPCETLPYASDLCANLPLPNVPAPAPSPQTDSTTPSPTPNPESSTISTARAYVAPKEQSNVPPTTVPSPGGAPQQTPSTNGDIRPHTTYPIHAKYMPSFLSLKQPSLADHYAVLAQRYQAMALAARTGKQ